MPGRHGLLVRLGSRSGAGRTPGHRALGAPPGGNTIHLRGAASGGVLLYRWIPGLLPRLRLAGTSCPAFLICIHLCSS